MPVKKITEILLVLARLDNVSYFLISTLRRDHLPTRMLPIHFSENLRDCQVSMEIKSCFAVYLKNRNQFLKDRKQSRLDSQALCYFSDYKLIDLLSTVKTQPKPTVLSKGTEMRDRLSQEVDILSQFSVREQKGYFSVIISIIANVVNLLNNFIQNQTPGLSQKILESETSKEHVRRKTNCPQI